MQSIECPRATPHANHRDASRRSPATKSKTRTRATARVTRARRSLCPPRASTAPPTHVHAAPAHMDCVHHLRSIAHALTPPALRSPHALNPKRCSPFPSPRRLRRETLDPSARPSRPPRRASRPAATTSTACAEEHCAPPPHRTGRRARSRYIRVHAPADRPPPTAWSATSTQRSHAAAPTSPRHACMYVYIGAPPFPFYQNRATL